MKKILSIVLIIIGLFFFTGVVALLPTVWGSVFTGILMLLCFYGAYKLYPKKEKQQKIETTKKEVKPVVETPKVKDEDPYNIPIISEDNIIEAKEKDEIQPNKTYNIGTPEFKKASDTMIDSFNNITDLILKPEKLVEENIDVIDEIKGNVLLELHDIYETENNKRSFKLLRDTLSYESDICDDLIYYCEDQDPTWLNQLEFTVEAINNNFKELIEIVSGKEEDR